MRAPAASFRDRICSGVLAERVRDWVSVPAGMELGTAARMWASPGWSAVCAVFLLVTLLHPVEGLPIRLCLFHQTFGIDCPACGLTRGLSHLWHGQLGPALGCHLLSPIAMVYLGCQTCYLILPPRARCVTIAVLNRYDRVFKVLWWVGILVFLVYGGCRAGWQWMGKGLPELATLGGWF